jgi:hypothetical protein
MMALIISLLFTAAAQDAAKVVLEADRDTVGIGETFVLTIRVSGGGVDSVTLPEADGLAIEGRPFSSSTGMSAVNGRVSQTNVLTFKAQAATAGTLTIPPATVSVDGKDIASNSLTIAVSESAATQRPRGQTLPRPTARRGMAPPSSDSSPEDESEISVEDLMSISAEVDKAEAYQGQPIVLTLVFMRMTSPYNVNPNELVTSLPELTGFYALPREPEETGPPETRTINGREYEAHYYKQTLFPTTVGDLEISAWGWQGTLGVRGYRPVHVELTSKPITVHVKPLPDQPPAFSGSVGTFQVEANLDKARTIQGVPVKLIVRVFGNGNPNGIGAPKLPAMDWAYVGDLEKDNGNQIAGVGAGVDQRFVFPITAIESGKKTIPEIEYCYFDPETGAYETAKTSALELEVVPSAEPEHKGVSGAGDDTENVQLLADDIVSIVNDPGPLKRSGSSTVSTSLALVAPPAVYAALAMLLGRRRRLATDSGFARSYRARSRVKKALEGVRDSREPAAALFKAVAGFIADKFNVPEAGMTSIDAQQLLDSQAAPTDVATALVKVLRSCERAQYASTRLSEDELAALLEGASVNLDALEAELKRRAQK